MLPVERIQSLLSIILISYISTWRHILSDVEADAKQCLFDQCVQCTLLKCITRTFTVKLSSPMPTANDQLRRLMTEHSLTQKAVAEYTQSSIETVKGWCAPPPTEECKSTRFRNMPSKKLSQLKLRVASAKKPEFYSYRNLRTWLKEKRIESNISLRSIAAALGSPSISKIEASTRKIEIMEFVAYCQAIGADPFEGLDILIQENHSQ